MKLAPFQTFSMLLFILIYLVAILWLYRKDAAKLHEVLAHKALDDGKRNEESRHD